MNLVKYMSSALTALMLWAGLSAMASADLLVIVNADNENQISVKFVKNLYQGRESRFEDGTDAHPIMQAEESTLTELFLDKIVKQKPVQFKRLWSKALFTGEGTPPEQLDSDAAVIAAVMSNPGAIGYIDSDNFTNDVRAIMRIKTE